MNDLSSAQQADMPSASQLEQFQMQVGNKVSAFHYPSELEQHEERKGGDDLRIPSSEEREQEMSQPIMQMMQIHKQASGSKQYPPARFSNISANSNNLYSEESSMRVDEFSRHSVNGFTEF